MSDETGQCILLLKLLWLDDEEASGSMKDCYECHTNTNQYYSCGKKIQKKRQKGLEVQLFTPPHTNYQMLCGPKPLPVCEVCCKRHETMDFETPCSLTVTGKKINLMPPPFPVRHTSAMKYHPKMYTSNCAKLLSSVTDNCAKHLRSASCKNSRRVRSARDEHLMELLNEFSAIRSRSQKAKELLQEKFTDRKLRLKQAFTCPENFDDVTKAKFMEDSYDLYSNIRSPNDSLLNCDCY